MEEIRKEKKKKWFGRRFLFDFHLKIQILPHSAGQVDALKSLCLSPVQVYRMKEKKQN